MDDGEQGSPDPGHAPGWGRLLSFALSEAYLVFVATLAVIAFLPAMIGWHATVVRTGSMEPHISPGDVVVAAPLDPRAPVPVGGVVQYRSPAAAEVDGVARLRLHRIVEVRDDGTFTTAGDANRDVDSTALERAQITGQARLLLPFIGLPGLWAGNGNVAGLLGWAAGTAAALGLVVRGSGLGPLFPGKAAGAAAGSAGSAGGAGPPGPNPPGPNPPGVSLPGRRAVLGLVGLATAGASYGAGATPSSAAAFTSRTVSSGKWAVAVLPTLTLGRAATYVLLAHSRIRHSPSLGVGTAITGSVATSPGSTVDGFWPWDITGSTDKNTVGARNAKTDVLALYAALDKHPASARRNPVLSGTLTPGVYTSTTGAFTVSGTLTLDAGGDATARFLFRAGTITAADRSRIVLTRGANANNVYWRATGDVSLGASSIGRGTYLANTNAAIGSGATLSGRMYSCTGTITVTRATIGTPA